MATNEQVHVRVQMYICMNKYTLANKSEQNWRQIKREREREAGEGDNKCMGNKKMSPKERVRGGAERSGAGEPQQPDNI